MISKRILIKDCKSIFNKINFVYDRTSHFLNKSEFLPAEDIQQFQIRSLKKLLLYANKYVPYYNRIFHKMGLQPANFSKIEDIQKYPFLTKDILRSLNAEFITRKISRKWMVKVFTGGTTGSPLSLYRYPSDFPREKAYEDFILRMQGIDPSSKKVYIRGEVEDKSGIYHAYSRVDKTLYLSSHNLSDNNILKYIDLINDFQPTLLYSLPSIATLLAEFIENKEVQITDSIKFAMVPSENIYPFQRELIERVFKCKVTSMYGHSEHCVIASPCHESDYFHVIPQYGFVELIDQNGDCISADGANGEIIATAFTNLGFPLIRYRTGDFAELCTSVCRCGRDYQLWRKIIGRGQAVAFTKNKGRISIGPDLLCTIYDKNYAKAKQFRIEQDEIGKLKVYVETYANACLEDVKGFFIQIFKDQFPDCFDVEVFQVETEFFNQTQKSLYFVQNVDPTTINQD